jgi:hypothetical protein
MVGFFVFVKNAGAARESTAKLMSDIYFAKAGKALARQ